MKEVRTKLFDSVLTVVDAMRGSQSRTSFLRHIIALGLKEQHAQASRNSPKNTPTGFGLAPLKMEGEAFYLDASTASDMQKLMDQVRYWG